MQTFYRSYFLFLIACSTMPLTLAQKPAQTPPVAFEEWKDDFNEAELDQVKWERFTFEGGSGGKIEVKDGQLRQRAVSGSRAGVRSKPSFSGDRFIVEGTVARVGPGLPDAGSKSMPLGFASLTLLFDSSGRNRVEWILTSEGTFEAWSIVDGTGERLDNRKLGTKIKNPTIGIVRRGDEFLFMLNGEEGMRHTIRNMPRTFHLMLNGYGSSENNWDDVRVVTAKS
ncbi:MAG: hypothetical protein M3Y84_08335 [Acidobacteriota bacterium]|nr:hypothetical protein [Acidobacteriota bacterium]